MSASELLKAGFLEISTKMYLVIFTLERNTYSGHPGNRISEKEDNDLFNRNMHKAISATGESVNFNFLATTFRYLSVHQSEIESY